MAVIEDVILQLGQIGLWVQAVGLVIVIWIIVQAITMYYNRKRRLLLTEINDRLKRIESKVEKLIKKSL